MQMQKKRKRRDSLFIKPHQYPIFTQPSKMCLAKVMHSMRRLLISPCFNLAASNYCVGLLIASEETSKKI